MKQNFKYTITVYTCTMLPKSLVYTLQELKPYLKTAFCSSVHLCMSSHYRYSSTLYRISEIWEAFWTTPVAGSQYIQALQRYHKTCYDTLTIGLAVVSVNTF